MEKPGPQGSQLHQERDCDMPHSVPVSKLMIPRNEWPQLRAETTIRDAIKVLRIVNEDRMLEHGHSTPLVLDDNYDLLGFVHLSDLLKSVRQFCLQPDRPCELDMATAPLRELVVPFAGKVEEDDSILKALEIMMDHGVSLVPVMGKGKLKGIINLSDIFNTVAALLFDEQDPEERGRLVKHYHW
jgi:CBS domain-containing protein